MCAARSIQLAARFTPEGPEPKGQTAFMEFWLAARQRALEARSRELKKRETELKKFITAKDKALPVIRQAMRGSVPPEAAGRKLIRLLPEKAHRKKLLNIVSVALKRTPAEEQRNRAEIERQEAEWAKAETRLRAVKKINDGLEDLATAAQAADVAAMEDLAQAAKSATALLGLTARAHPSAMRAIQRRELRWPVLAGGKPGWERKLADDVEKMELGADLPMLRTPFREARGSEGHLPGRRWAKAAVRVILETQLRVMTLGALAKEFGPGHELADWAVGAGWHMEDPPSWMKAALGLKPLSKPALPDWRRVVRDVIRQQMPDFHQHPDWERQRETEGRRGRVKTGDLQNAILDDISSALASITPAN